MPVNKVSFGSVIAVSGKREKVGKVNRKIHPQANYGNVIMKDVTPLYKNVSSNGMIAQSVQNGDKVEIYITGRDVDKVKNKTPDWDTMGGILSNLSGYYNLNETYVDDVVNNILNS